MKVPSARTSRKAASSLGISGSYSARTSTSGIAMRCNFSLRFPSVGEIRREEDDAGHDRVLRVLEVVVEVVVARPEAVADPDERERPHSRADEREREERGKRHLEDSRRDGDERSDDRRHRPEQNSRLVPALEPRVSLVEPFRRHVQPAAAALEQLTSSETADEP